jgi:hypothetical protein
MKIQIPRYEDGAIGLPKSGRAITVSNTERRRLACSRQWWLAEIERLSTPPSGAMRRGTAWHDFLEDVHRWFMRYDRRFPEGGSETCVLCVEESSLACERCNGTGEGALVRYRRALVAFEVDGLRAHTDEEVEAEVDTLRRMIEGWFAVYGREPSETYRVVGVEVAIARPICNPSTGRVYAPESFVVREADGSERLAGTGEVSGAVALPDGATLRSSRLPWYQIGRLDCILRHRRTGVLYVGEWKSSGNPLGLVDGLALDPQTDGYCWLLEHAVEIGEIGESGDEVVGYIFDVASTAKQYDPQVLKSGAFSKAKRTIPSWRWLDAIASHGFAESEYRSQIDEARRSTDPKLYVREWGVSNADTRARYGEEMFATARRLSTLRREVARASTVEDLNVAVPRTPICRLPGGFCSYRAPCLLDGEDARARFETSPGISWRK